MAVYVSNINAVQRSLIAPSILGYVPPRWAFVLGQGQPEYEMQSISARSLSVKLTDPATASFTVMGDMEIAGMPEASLINEMIDDLWIYRNGKKLFRGRVMNSTDTIDSTGYTVAFTANDYSALLERRMVVTANPTLPMLFGGRIVALSIIWDAPVTPENVVWGLIAHAESQPGMALGITQGEWAVTGNPPSVEAWEFQDGEPIGAAVRKIAAMDPSFDFWVNAELKANIQKERGIARGVSLDYGGVVASVNRTFDTSTFANVVRQSGDNTSPPWTYPLPGSPEEQALIAAPEGGWCTAIGDTSLGTSEQTQKAGKANYERLSLMAPSYSVVLTHGAWGGPDHVWVGDSVNLIVKRGRLVQVSEKPMRVHEISISIDQNDIEEVTLTLNWPNNPTDSMKKFAANVNRLNVR